ncbi:MAG: virulence factor, partial [Bacilli bacterium]
MKIKSIEPTPSPNTMKLNMDQSLPSGSKMTYTLENQHKGPDYVKKLLQIEGIQSLFQVNDFIAIERYPKGDWQQILTAARGVFGEEPSQQTINADLNQLPTAEAFGEVHVFIQMFKGIPMQIKLTSGMEQVRVALPERFGQAALSV